MPRSATEDWDWWAGHLEESYYIACLIALGIAYRAIPDGFDPDRDIVDCADCAAAHLGVCELMRNNNAIN